MSKHKTALVDGQLLSYWAARCADNNREVRDEARAALQAFRRLRAKQMAAFVDDIPALYKLFWQHGSGTADEVYWCLKMMGPLILPSLPTFLDTFRGKRDYSPHLAAVLLGLAQKGREGALPLLMEYLHNVRTGYSVFEHLAKGVHKLGPDAAAVVPFLEAKFGGHDHYANRAIAAVLGRVGLGVPTLIKALTNKDRETRENAARSLGQIRVTEAVPHLIKSLADDDYTVASTAAESLGKFGEAAQAAVGPLTDASKSKSKNLRAAAAAALKLLPAATPEEQARWTARKARSTAASSHRTNEDMLHFILDNPDDVTARLVYADWLEEQSNPRGEFIRVQCQVAEMADDDPQRPPLQARETELWDKHGKTWRKEVPAWPLIVRFRRGFAEEVQCPAKAFLKQGAGLFRRAPIIALTLTSVENHLPALAACPLLCHLRSLHLRRFSDELVASPHLANLTCLDLHVAKVDDALCEVIAGSPHLSRLTRLLLHGNDIGDRGVSALARSPHLANLTALHLGHNPFSPAAVRSIAASPNLTKLTEFPLWHCAVEAEGAEALAASKCFAHLTTLRLSDCRVGDHGAAAIARSANFPQVVNLMLGNNGIGGEGVAAIAGSSKLAKLVSLSLDRNQIDDAGAEALADAKFLTKLKSLSLTQNPLSDRGVLALVRSRHLSGLTSLKVDPWNLGTEAKQALKERFG